MSATSAPSTTEQTTTRDRLVESAAVLFRRHGYAATGVKAVLAAADAPYGSLYHFFPGGKRQLGMAALAHNSAHGRAQIESDFPPGTDIVEAAEAAFLASAERLQAIEYLEACPIATIALEVANSDEALRTAAAEAFESWLAVLEERLTTGGMAAEPAREVAVGLFCLMEGARLLSRTTRSPEALRVAGRLAGEIVATALEGTGDESA